MLWNDPIMTNFRSVAGYASVVISFCTLIKIEYVCILGIWYQYALRK